MCEEQATRILLGQYHVRAEGRDGELMAKDRYEVARAYLELSKRLRETENRNAELLAACRAIVESSMENDAAFFEAWKLCDKAITDSEGE